MSNDLVELQQLDQVPAASPSPQKAPVVRRKLWDENATKSRLGAAGYAWFVERAEEGITKCKHCKGSGSVVAPGSTGILPGFPVSSACEVCGSNIESLIDFTRIYFDTVPPAYRRFTLRTLQPYLPSPVPVEQQANVMGTVKANPDKSYAFFGSPGAGKTVVSTALYSEMLFRQFMRPHPRWKWFPVRRISVNKMLDQHAEYAIRRNDPDWTDLDRTLNAPDVTADKIRAVTQTGDKYRLFLEDMNGGEGTDRRRADLFDVINAIYENDGQLVITSNLTPAEFKRQYGDDLFWRITERCTVVEVFDGKDKK